MERTRPTSAIQATLEELEIHGVEVYDCGLVWNPDVPVEKYFEFIDRGLEGDVQWRFSYGDAIAQGQEIYGEDYWQMFGNPTEFKTKTLRNWGYVAAGIPQDMRRPDVAWSAYAEIYSLTDDFEKQDLIEKCAEGMTVEELREHKGGDQGTKTGDSYTINIEPVPDGYKASVDSWSGIIGYGKTEWEAGREAWEAARKMFE